MKALLLLTTLFTMSARAADAPPASDKPTDAFVRAWSTPAEPLRVIGNIHYVGTAEIGIYLITTPAGHILLDSGYEPTGGLVLDSVRRLGFLPEDIRIILSTHAHADHVAAHAPLRRATKARVLVSAGDAPNVRSGGKTDPLMADVFSWEPCPVDGVVRDGQKIRLGDTTMVAHLTPGHTAGATTWTTTVRDNGRTLSVLFYSSATVLPGMKLTPAIVRQFEGSFRTWSRLKPDVFLAPHASFFDMVSKRDRLKAAPDNPFIDPEAYRRLVDKQQAEFRSKLSPPR